MKVNLLSILSASAILVAAINVASAQSVDFAFNGPGNGDYGAVGTSSDYFNAITEGGTTGAALAPNGTTATSVTFTDNSLFNYSSANQAGNPSDPIFNPYLGENNGSTITETLNGVAAGSYSLYLYSENGGFNGRGATFTLGGVSQTALNDGTDTTPTLGANYVVYSNVTPVNGTITFTYTAPSGQGEGDFNGLQLVAAAPEPSSWAMMLGGVVLLAFALRVRANRA